MADDPAASIKKRLKSSHTDRASDLKPKSARRGRWGKLASIMELPMDVLFEIFGHLTSGDLVRLARITKEFRRVLLNRSSVTLWRRARENVPGLPECPDDMSEPAYANLVFSQHCHFCSCPNIRSVDWMFRIRVCNSCAKKEFGEMDAYLSAMKEEFLLIPSRTVKRRGNHRATIYLKSQYMQLEEKMSCMDQEKRVALIEKWKPRLESQFEHAKRCEDWSRGLANDRSQELARLKQERHDAIVLKLEELGWKTEIKKILGPDSLSGHPLVKQPHKLTERVWSRIKPEMIEYMESMKNKRLERERRARILRRRWTVVSVFRQFKIASLQNSSDLLPVPADFMAFRQVKALFDDPSDSEWTGETLHEFGLQIPQIVSDWRQKIRGDLAFHIHSLLQAKNGKHMSPEAKVEPALANEEAFRLMDLAATAYRCQQCSISEGLHTDEEERPDPYGAPETKVLFFPEVLGHHCFIHAWKVNPGGTRLSRSNEQNQELEEVLWSMRLGSQCPVHFSKVVLDERYSSIAAALVKMVGLSPENAKARDMDNLERRFYCQSCYGEKLKQASLAGSDFVTIPYCNWREMTTHIAEFHPSGRGPDVYLLPADFLLRLEEKGINDLKSTDVESTRPLRVWRCVHCLDSTGPYWRRSGRMTREAMESHVKSMHHKLDPLINVDFYTCFDALDHYPVPIRQFQSRKVLVAHKRLLPLDPTQAIDFDAILPML